MDLTESGLMDPSEQLRWKKEAAEAAAALIQDGMVLGLGTGSTAALFLRALGRRISEEPLRISGIPTSDETAALARGLKIPLTDFSEHVQIDLTVDGADEVEQSTLFLIKGHGGALLREKIVAAASKRMIVVADQTKLSERLGSLVSVPVEGVPFGSASLAENRRCGSARMASGSTPTAGTTLSTAPSDRWKTPRRSRTISTTWSVRWNTGCS